MAASVINSWDQLREQVSTILEDLNSDPPLARAAGVNPLLALEELGFEIAPDARMEIEDRLRFNPRQYVRRSQLREAIFAQAGRSFDVASSRELHQVLFEELGLSVPPDERGCFPPLPDTGPLPPQMEHHEPVTDPLEVLGDQHAIIEPLLEYRRLEAATPRLAPRPLFDAVRHGDRTLGIVSVRGRLKEDTGESPATTSEERLNVNTAAVEELARVPYVGRRLADRIVAYREAHGPFKRLEDLMDVRGIGSKLMNQIRDRLTTKL